jgi:hypothetical protein
VANNNYPQITTITSETLQAQIRTLLPSQEGFGTDLMAQNVIVPIIDLTRAAEGSTVPQILQTAIAFGSQTSFNVTNTSTTIANTAGFYRVVGTAYCTGNIGSSTVSNFTLSNGFSTKVAWQLDVYNSGTAENAFAGFDLVFFLSSGESLNAVSGALQTNITGSIRQIADVNGTLVNPSGFSPQ